MFGLFGDTTTKGTHNYHMVIKLENEPRNKVRDVHGQFTIPDDGKTVEDVQDTIIRECRKQLGVDCFIVSFDYQ